MCCSQHGSTPGPRAKVCSGPGRCEAHALKPGQLEFVPCPPTELVVTVYIMTSAEQPLYVLYV